MRMLIRRIWLLSLQCIFNFICNSGPLAVTNDNGSMNRRALRNAYRGDLSSAMYLWAYSSDQNLANSLKLLCESWLYLRIIGRTFARLYSRFIKSLMWICASLSSILPALYSLLMDFRSALRGS